MRVQVQCNAHLPALSLWYGEKSRTILVGTVLPTLQGHVICKNWHMLVVCWEDCKHKNLHLPTPLPPSEVATNIVGLLKTARGD